MSCLPLLLWAGWSHLWINGLWAEAAAGQAICVQGGRAPFPQGRDCRNHCFLDLRVLTALSVPPIAAVACAGVTHFKPRLTSKETGFLPMLLPLNSLSKWNWRMPQ